MQEAGRLSKYIILIKNKSECDCVIFLGEFIFSHNIKAVAGNVGKRKRASFRECSRRF